LCCWLPRFPMSSQVGPRAPMSFQILPSPPKSSHVMCWTICSAAGIASHIKHRRQSKVLTCETSTFKCYLLTMFAIGTQPPIVDGGDSKLFACPEARSTMTHQIALKIATRKPYTFNQALLAHKRQPHPPRMLPPTDVSTHIATFKFPPRLPMLCWT